jgi:hypothetical protein
VQPSANSTGLPPGWVTTTLGEICERVATIPTTKCLKKGCQRSDQDPMEKPVFKKEWLSRARAVNAVMTATYWEVGRRISSASTLVERRYNSSLRCLVSSVLQRSDLLSLPDN